MLICRRRMWEIDPQKYLTAWNGFGSGSLGRSSTLYFIIINYRTISGIPQRVMARLPITVFEQKEWLTYFQSNGRKKAKGPFKDPPRTRALKADDWMSDSGGFRWAYLTQHWLEPKSLFLGTLKYINSSFLERI